LNSRHTGLERSPQPQKGIRLALFILPVLMTVFFLALKIFQRALYVRMIQEDALLENGQFIAYVAAGVVALIAGFVCKRNGKRLEFTFLLVLGLGLLFAGLEEINWGQRLFGIKTPAYFQQHNEQQELNIHNLAPIHYRLHKLYVLVGSILAFAWIPEKWLRQSRIVSDGLKSAVALMTPKWYLMTFFLPVVFFYSFALKFPALIQSARFLLWRDQEAPELLLALGFLAFSLCILLRARGGSFFKSL
jgi:hypothetical protein